MATRHFRPWCTIALTSSLWTSTCQESTAFEVCRRVKGDPAMQLLPVVLITRVRRYQDPTSAYVPNGTPRFLPAPRSELSRQCRAARKWLAALDDRSPSSRENGARPHGHREAVHGAKTRGDRRPRLVRFRPVEGLADLWPGAGPRHNASGVHDGLPRRCRERRAGRAIGRTCNVSAPLPSGGCGLGLQRAGPMAIFKWSALQAIEVIPTLRRFQTSDCRAAINQR
jgi:hypothetical protein